jgi:hypothetical protein
VALDPFSETANRDLMRHLVGSGDRPAALTVYARLAERLQHELSVLPSRETRALAREIRMAAEDDEAADDAAILPGAIARAAVTATRAGAHGEAAALYERAAHLVDANVTSALRYRCELLVELAQSRLRAGEPHRVREPALEAAEVARRIGDAGLLADAVLVLCSVPFFPGEDPVDVAAVALLREALELTPPSDAADRARLLARLAREVYFVAAAGEVEELSAQACSLARDSGDGGALAAALDSAHLARAGVGETSERLALVEEMIAAAARADAPELLLRAHVLRGVNLLELGDLESVGAEADRLERLSAELRRPAFRWWPSLWRAARAIGEDRFEAGGALADEALAFGSAQFGEAAALEHRAQRLCLVWKNGALAEHIEEVAALADRYDGLPALRCALALAFAQAGRVADARALVGELAGSDFARLRRDAGWLIAAALLADACATLGERETGTALRTTLGPYADRHAVSAHGSIWLGPVSATLSRLDDATGGRVGASA